MCPADLQVLHHLLLGLPQGPTEPVWINRAILHTDVSVLMSNAAKQPDCALVLCLVILAGAKFYSETMEAWVLRKLLS